MRQITFARQPSFEKYGRMNRREAFLTSMETIVPWSELEALVAPYYPKAGGDAGYQGQTEAIHEAAPQAQDMTSRRVNKSNGKVDQEQKRKNRTKSRVRARVEWPFRILRRVFHYTKVRYRGIKKNHEWLLTAFALVNLYQHRKRLAQLGA
jgi:IS5 family transposase